MPHNGPTDDTTECGLHGFERNRFFHGKLMTARDMQAEQRYHRNRLRTMAQHVTGSGIVCGLETTVEEQDDSLVVRIEPGFAIDDCGHPIVVEGTATEELDVESVPEPFSLYVDYDDCVKESVPVPGSEDACDQECTYNRVLEIFELTTEAEPPIATGERKPVDAVEFAGKGDYTTASDPRDPASIDRGDEALRKIAASYAEADDGSLQQCERSENHRVFLGRFDRQSDGTWDRVTTNVESRPLVYTNDMLYAGLARHAARFDDPHDVTAGQAGALKSVAGVSNAGGDVALTSDDSISIEARPNDYEVSFAVAQWILDSIISSINGVEANDAGNVEFISDSGTIDVDPDGGGDHELSIDVVDEAVLDGVVKSISEVSPADDGDVELFSDSEILSVDPRGGNRLEITFDEAKLPDTDAVETVHSVPPDDEGDVKFVSPDETIDFTPTPGANQVEFDLADRIRGQLDAHCRYVLDKTLKTTIRSFYRVADVYSNTQDTEIPDVALQIIKSARNAIEEEEFRDPVKFASTAENVLDKAIKILNEIRTDDGGNATDPTRAVYKAAIERLDSRLGSISGDATCAEAVGVAVALDWVCETARWLHDEEDERSVMIPGTEEEIEGPIVHDLVRDGQT